MRLGQKNGLVRQWARTGTRPRQPKDQRYQSAYLFGAICPARGTGAAVAMPFADTHAMQAHLEEIGRTVAAGAHAACRSPTPMPCRPISRRSAALSPPAPTPSCSWTAPVGTPPANLSSPKTSRRCCCRPDRPNLNACVQPTENVWQYLRQTYLSNRVFDSYDAIIDAACDAWNQLIDKPSKIMSIGMREWAHSGQTQ